MQGIRSVGNVKNNARNGFLVAIVDKNEYQDRQSKSRTRDALKRFYWILAIPPMPWRDEWCAVPA